MDADMKIVGKQLILDGYIYYRANVVKGRSYWECKKVKLGECSARAITRFNGDELVLIKGYDKSPHSNHLPNREEAEAEVKKDGIKRAAEEFLELPPAAILRRELADVPDGVLSQLPECENLKKAIRQRREKNFPTNPTSLDNLDEVPSTFQNTKAGEKCLVYDSREHDDVENGRILIFATKRNLEILSTCGTWYLDGQSMYRKVQSEGLQRTYNNSEDGTLKLHTHMYNQYHATLSGAQRTNNCSEGWHNRFHLLLGKNHPDLYSLLKNFQSEQADLEIMCRELSLGKKVAAGPKRKWLETQKRLRRIADDYETYKEENRIFTYLETLAHTIVL